MHGIAKYIKENGGYARLTELRNQGFQSRDISKLYEEGVLEKVQPGLYKLRNSDITSGFVDISHAMSHAVIALVSALAYHELIPRKLLWQFQTIQTGFSWTIPD